MSESLCAVVDDRSSASGGNSTVLETIISSGPILSRVSCLTPALHYYLSREQDYAVTASYRKDSHAFVSTAAYILVLSQCVKDSGG